MPWCGSNFKSIIFKLIIQNKSFGTCCEIAPRWMPKNYIWIMNHKSTKVQVMAWYHQAMLTDLCHLIGHINCKNVTWASWCMNPWKLDPDNKVHGANMGPIRDRQDPGGPHVGPMNLAIWGLFSSLFRLTWTKKTWKPTVQAIFHWNINLSELRFWKVIFNLHDITFNH